MCNARVLHVDNLVIPLHAEKFTTPSLNIAVDNTVLYAPMVPWFIWNRVHVGDNGIVYSVCMGEKTHVGNHWFIGDCLVGADDGVYLESNGTQYIDTGVSKNNGITFNLTVNFSSCPNYYCMNGLLNDVQIGVAASGMWHTYLNGDGGDTIFAEYNKWYKTELICNNNKCDLYANGDFISSAHFSKNYYGFAISATNSNSGANHFAYEKIKYFSVVNNGVLIRQMIPVPAGLVIGGYTVPENGMWDVVKQQFYGNAGSGEFIYGVDE